MSSTHKNRGSPFLKQCFVTASVAINIIGQGAVFGFPAILLPQLAKEGSILKLDASAASWIASIIGISQFLGSLITPHIMERYGRKKAHLAATLPNFVGWFMITLATNFESMFAARFLQGLSLGMLAPLRSTLIGEYTSPKYRGAFLTTVSLAISFGLVFVYILGSLMSWQLTALVLLFCPFTSFVMTIYSPESPSWLAAKNRHQECREVFHWLRGDGEDEELEEMIHARTVFNKERISKKIERKVSNFTAIKETILKPEFYKPVILMMHAHVLINFSGGTTMSVYSTVIIETVMGPEVNADLWMIILGVQRLFSNALAVLVINRFKRKTMMFTTGALSILSQFALAAYILCRQSGTLTYSAIWLPALLINLKYFAVGIGMLPLPNVIGGEVFPLEYRSIGGTISFAAYCATNFLVLKTFIGLVDMVGMAGSYVVYGGIITYCMVVIWVLLPETKGRTLQQIEDYFRGYSLAPVELTEKIALKTESCMDYEKKAKQ